MVTTKFFCPLWGMESLGIAEAAKRVKAAGYDGMEVAVGDNKYEETVNVLKDNGLELILMAFGGSNKFPDQKQKFREDLYKIASHKPLFINSHTGRDYFLYEQNCELIQVAADVQKQTGVKILHETHRGRFTYSAPATQHYFLTFPDLRLTGDFSHWVNVAESYLGDQADNVNRAIQRTDHIHSRVGHPEGPQVNDPRAPEWKDALESHARWWDAIRERHQRAGSQTLTITCEFGPAGYLPTLPFTQQPVASQWDINVFMKDWLKKRWS